MHARPAHTVPAHTSQRLAHRHPSSCLRHILSCALYNNWYPLLILVCYVIAPLPMCCFLAARGGDSLLDASSGSKAAQHWAEFLSSVGVSVIVGLPFVL